MHTSLLHIICRRIISLHSSLCDSPVVVSHIGVLLGSHVPNPLSNIHLDRQNEVPSCHSCPNHSGTTHHFSYYHRAKWWLWYHHLWLLLLSWLEGERYVLWCGCPHKYYVHHLHISLDYHCLEHSGTLCIYAWVIWPCYITVHMSMIFFSCEHTELAEATALTQGNFFNHFPTEK